MPLARCPRAQSTAAEEIEAVKLDETKQAPPVRVCDPFWDVEGALGADLFAAAK